MGSTDRKATIRLKLSRSGIQQDHVVSAKWIKMPNIKRKDQELSILAVACDNKISVYWPKENEELVTITALV